MEKMLVMWQDYGIFSVFTTKHRLLNSSLTLPRFLSPSPSQSQLGARQPLTSKRCCRHNYRNSLDQAKKIPIFHKISLGIPSWWRHVPNGDIIKMTSPFSLFFRYFVIFVCILIYIYIYIYIYILITK